MKILFAETLRKLRTDNGLSQRELAEKMYVTRSTVSRWEIASRLPDAAMMVRLAKCLGTDVESEDAPNVILVDDRKLFLSNALLILEEVMPNAIITGFTSPAGSDCIRADKQNCIGVFGY